MSFLPKSSGEGGLTFWQQLALVAVPAFIGAAIPPTVDAILRRTEKKTEHSNDKAK